MRKAKRAKLLVIKRTVLVSTCAFRNLLENMSTSKVWKGAKRKCDSRICEDVNEYVAICNSKNLC